MLLDGSEYKVLLHLSEAKDRRMRMSELAAGGPDVLHVADRPAPAAGDGQVLVRVEARSVNAPDAGIREGLFADWTPQRTFPIVLGADFAGRVLRDSGSFTAGERVLGILPWFTDTVGRGSYAEILAAESDWLAPLPDGLEAAAAATIPLNAQSD